MADVKFKRLDTANRVLEAVEDGKYILDYQRPSIYLDEGTTRIELTPRDTALSTTSTNPIENQALTNSIIDTLEDVLATTVDHIPCGTQPLKLMATTPTFTIATGDWSLVGGRYIANKTWVGLKTTHTIESWVQSAAPLNTAPTATEIANEALYQYAVPSATDTIRFISTPTAPTATITVRASIVGI